MASLCIVHTLSIHATCFLLGVGLDIPQEWVTSWFHCLTGTFLQQRCAWGYYIHVYSARTCAFLWIYHTVMAEGCVVDSPCPFLRSIVPWQMQTYASPLTHLRRVLLESVQTSTAREKYMYVHVFFYTYIQQRSKTPRNHITIILRSCKAYTIRSCYDSPMIHYKMHHNVV